MVKTKNAPKISSSVSRSVLRSLLRRKFSAFTLVELVVVIAILAVLATVGFLALSGYTKDASSAAASTNARQVWQAIMAESTKNGDSPRNYVVYQTGASLSGATYSGVTLTGGSYGTAGTSYTAGTPDWNKLRLDPSRFTAKAALPAWSPIQIAEAGSATPYAGAADVTDGSTISGKVRYRSYSQAALQDSAGAWHVAGNWPGSSVPGTSSGLIADPTDSTRSLAVTDSAPGTLTGSSSQGGSQAYSLSNSLRLPGSASSYLRKDYSASGNRLLGTYSLWIKRGNVGINQLLVSAGSSSSTSPWEDQWRFNVDDTMSFIWNGNGASGDVFTTSQVFRDPSAWYHLVAVVDMGNAVRSERFRLYVNGTRVTVNATGAGGNSQGAWNATGYPQAIGIGSWNWTSPLDGYVADVNFVDGQALAAADFGQADSNGVWTPKAFTGTYGANGFRLDFSSGAALGNDAAPITATGHTIANTWTLNGLSASDQMSDSPTNNFAVMNPLDKNSSSLSASKGNLIVANTANASNVGMKATMAASSGKWYWEATRTSWNVYEPVGIATVDSPLSSLSANA
jgi:prepilin-type N-terminal cleavage/methylation domain-containing protein